MLICVFLEMRWLFWSSQDEEHCWSCCAHCAPVNSEKSPSVLAVWGLLSVQWVLVMDKQRERLWKATCENSNALLLTERGVMCRAELPLFSFPPLPPLFPCGASCMCWQVGAFGFPFAFQWV